MKLEIELFIVPSIFSIQDMIFQSCTKFKNKLALEDYLNTPFQKRR